MSNSSFLNIKVRLAINLERTAIAVIMKVGSCYMIEMAVLAVKLAR